MTVNDTVKQSFFTYPTLYLGDSVEDIKMAVLHHYIIVLGNGIEWANTKDKNKGGYLTEPKYYNRRRIYDKPYGKLKIEENIEDYIYPNIPYELVLIDHEETKDFMETFGKYRKNGEVYIRSKIEHNKTKSIYIEREFDKLPPNTMMPGNKYSDKYTYALRTFNDRTRNNGRKDNPYPNFSEKYSCFYEPGAEYIKDDWREESIRHLEYWQQYFIDEERIKTYSYYPKKNENDILNILKSQINDEHLDPEYVFKNYGFKKFDLNDPIAFELAKIEKFNRHKKEVIEFIEKTIFKLKK